MHQAEQDLLVLEAQNGNDKAFECLIQYFHPQLIKFANQLCSDPAMAKDATQDVWLSIGKPLRRLSDPRAFKSWLFRAVRWRVLDLVKVNAREQESVECPEYLDNPFLTVEFDDSNIELRPLRKAIEQLPQQERATIYLFYMAEFSVKQIARVLEIPLGTVKSRLSRARKILKQQLTQPTDL